MKGERERKQFKKRVVQPFAKSWDTRKALSNSPDRIGTYLRMRLGSTLYRNDKKKFMSESPPLFNNF